MISTGRLLLALAFGYGPPNSGYCVYPGKTADWSCIRRKAQLKWASSCKKEAKKRVVTGGPRRVNPKVAHEPVQSRPELRFVRREHGVRVQLPLRVFNQPNMTCLVVIRKKSISIKNSSTRPGNLCNPWLKFNAWECLHLHVRGQSGARKRAQRGRHWMSYHSGNQLLVAETDRLGHLPR